MLNRKQNSPHVVIKTHLCSTEVFKICIITGLPGFNPPRTHTRPISHACRASQLMIIDNDLISDQLLDKKQMMFHQSQPLAIREVCPVPRRIMLPVGRQRPVVPAKHPTCIQSWRINLIKTYQFFFLNVRAKNNFKCDVRSNV